MSKLRVYMVGKELGLDNKTLVAMFQSIGATDVRNHMSAVAPEQVERVRRQLSKHGDEEHRLIEERVQPQGGGGVIIRRGKKDGPESRGPERPREEEVPVKAAAPTVVRRQGAPSVERRPAAVVAEPEPVAESSSAAPSEPAAPVQREPRETPPPAAAESRVEAPRAEVAPAVTRSAEPAPEVKAVEAVTAPKHSGVDSQPVTHAAVEEAAQSMAAPPTQPTGGQPREAEPSRPPHADEITAGRAAAAAEPAAPPPAASAPSHSASTAGAATSGAPTTSAAAAVATHGASTANASTAGAATHSASTPAASASAAATPRVAASGGVASGAATPGASTPAVTSGAAARSSGGAASASTPSAPTSPAARPAAAAGASRPSSTVVRPASGGATAGRPPAGRPADNTATAQRPSSPPRTGIDVWEGRPGVPMPQAPRGGLAPRRVQYDAKTGGGGPGGPQRRGPQMSGPGGRPGQRGGGRPGQRGFGALAGRRPLGSVASSTQERSAHKKVVKIEGNIAVQILAGKMGIKAAELLMKLLGLGMTGVNINTTLDSDTSKIVAAEFGWAVEDVTVSEDAAIAAAQGGEGTVEEGERVPRPPVVTVMGHVDHGKTSLLDKIRKAQVASGEAGGITQHIGAYSVKTHQGRITFLDTPGHEAFTLMRARGAKCTDIVVLVVAADDGVMPQTKEAINHARDAGCPIVVAINKIDKPEAQPERVRRELSDVGLMPEEWGGDTLFCEVSAHSGDGIEQLLDTILLQAEVLDLRANPNRHARGTVIEAKLDRGRGPVATVLVLEGTLRKGDGVLVGNSWGRVRAMLDDGGRNLSEAGPATPVAVIGLSEVPAAGDNVDAVEDVKKAQQIAEQRRAKLAERARGATTKVSLEELARRMSQADQKDLKVIVKADVQGSVEALNMALEKLSTDKVKVTVVHSGVGAITEGDVNLAVASGALIIGFNTRPAGKARDLAQREGIEIRQYSVIYDVTDDVRASMEGLLAPTLIEEAIGEAEVRRIFKVTKAGVVAGCMVIKGVVRRNAMVRLRRADAVIWEGKLDSLKRFKDDAKEVREGFDCGISFQGYNDLLEGDVIAVFEMKEVRPTL